MSTVTQEIQDQVSSLYIAFFGRAPDAKGFGHWAEELAAGASPFKIAADFALSPEWTSNYGGLTPTQQVNRFYQNTFGRQADAAGLEYWVDEIEGGLPFSTVAYQIIWAAYLGGDTVDPADNALVLNKIAVAEYFAIELSSNDTAIAATAFVGVTQNPATVTAAEARLADAVNPPETFTLTTDIDNFVGKSLDVEFTGVSGSTLDTGDTLTGGPGVSTFNITGNGGSAIVETTGIQTVNVRAVSDTTINQVLMSGVAAASSQNSLDNVTFTNAQLATTYGLFNTNNIVGDTANLSVTYQAASGTADTALLSVNNAGGKVGSNTITQTINTTASTGDIEAISLATAGSNQVTLAGGAKVSAVDVSGNGTNTITLTSAATTMTLDASESSGTNTLIVNDLLSTTDTIIGGSGTDTLRATIATGTQMLPTVTGVETLDFTFTAAGIVNAKNIADVTKITVTPTAASTFTNLSEDVATVQVGKTTAVTAGGLLSVGYATGSESDVTLNLGATPTTGTAVVSLGAVTFSGNTGALTVNSAGTATNLITGALTANSASALTIAGVSQALTGAAVSATGAATVTVDGTLKNTSITTAAVDNSLSAFNVTAGAGTATAQNVTQTTSAGNDVDVTYNVTSAAKAASLGNVTITGGATAGDTVNASLVVSGGVAAASAGTFKVDTANATGLASTSLTASATEGAVSITGFDLRAAKNGSSGSIDLTSNGGSVVLTTLNVASTSATATDSTTVSIVAEATASTDSVTITTLSATGAGTGITGVSTITLSGKGDVSINAADGSTFANTSDTVVDAVGLTGSLTLNLASSTSAADINIVLGNAASTDTNTVTTGAGADVIVGGSGKDVMVAGHGADNLTGGGGNDSLTGNAGADVLSGGTGNDTFIYLLATDSSPSTTVTTTNTATILAEIDAITDFLVSGSDQIDLAAVEVGTMVIGSANVAAAAGTTGTDFLTALDAAASAATGAVDSIINVFSWSGNQYLVIDRSDTASFVEGTDMLIKLDGTNITATGGVVAGLFIV